LDEAELLGALARCPRVFADVAENFRAFTDRFTGLDVRRKKQEVEDPKAKSKGAKK
jgi:hypothetical protein